MVGIADAFVTSLLFLIFAVLNSENMGRTKLKKKTLRDRAKAAIRRQSLKLQNYQPVVRTVDVEKIKEEFKAGKKA